METSDAIEAERLVYNMMLTKRLVTVMLRSVVFVAFGCSQYDTH